MTYLLTYCTIGLLWALYGAVQIYRNVDDFEQLTVDEEFDWWFVLGCAIVLVSVVGIVGWPYHLLKCVCRRMK